MSYVAHFTSNTSCSVPHTFYSVCVSCFIFHSFCIHIPHLKFHIPRRISHILHPIFHISYSTLFLTFHVPYSTHAIFYLLYPVSHILYSIFLYPILDILYPTFRMSRIFESYIFHVSHSRAIIPFFSTGMQAKKFSVKSPVKTSRDILFYQIKFWEINIPVHKLSTKLISGSYRNSFPRKINTVFYKSRCVCFSEFV